MSTIGSNLTSSMPSTAANAGHPARWRRPRHYDPRRHPRGQILRLRGKGMPGISGGPPGDALIEVGVRPHPLFTRDKTTSAWSCRSRFAPPCLAARSKCRPRTGPSRMTVPNGPTPVVCFGSRARACRVVTAAAGDEYVKLTVIASRQARSRARAIHGPVAGRPGRQLAASDGCVSMEDHEFRGRACLEVEALEAWVAAGWLVCSASAEGQDFTRNRRGKGALDPRPQRDIGVNDEGIGVILDLIDKLHGMRRTLGHLLSAIQAQPDDVRQRLIVSAHEAIVVHHTSWVSDKSASPRPKSAGSGEPGGH